MVNAEDLEIGVKVKLITNSPKHGQGGVRIGDIGVVVKIEKRYRGDNNPLIIIDFPSHRYWHGRCQDLDLAEDNNQLNLHLLNMNDPFLSPSSPKKKPMKFNPRTGVIG